MGDLGWIIAAVVAWIVLAVGFWALVAGSPDSDNDPDPDVRTVPEPVEQSRCISTGMEPLTDEQAAALNVLADVERADQGLLPDVPSQRLEHQRGGVAQYPPFNPLTPADRADIAEDQRHVRLADGDEDHL